MDSIDNVNVHLTPITNTVDNIYGAFIYINHNEASASYDVYKKTSLDSDFILLDNIVLHDYFFPLPKNITTVQFKVVGKKSGESNVTFSTEILNIPTTEFFVTITGYLTSMEGTKLTNTLVYYELMPHYVEFEVNGMVINKSIEGVAVSDGNGKFEVTLPANRGADGSKVINMGNTYYEFTFSNSSIKREINIDDGLAQSFSDLRVPERMRRRRDNFLDMLRV